LLEEEDDYEEVQVVLESTQTAYSSIRRPRDICLQLIAFIISLVGIDIQADGIVT